MPDDGGDFWISWDFVGRFIWNVFTLREIDSLYLAQKLKPKVRFTASIEILIRLSSSVPSVAKSVRTPTYVI